MKTENKWTMLISIQISLTKKKWHSKFYLIDWTFIIYRNRLWVICIFNTYTLTHALSYMSINYFAANCQMPKSIYYFQNETNKSTAATATCITLYTHKLYIIIDTHAHQLYLHKLNFFFNRPGFQMNSIKKVVLCVRALLTWCIVV